MYIPPMIDAHFGASFPNNRKGWRCDEGTLAQTNTYANGSKVRKCYIIEQYTMIFQAKIYDVEMRALSDFE